MEDDPPRPAPSASAAFEAMRLDAMGIEELEAYVARLEAEIARARAEIARKRAQREAAAALFRAGSPPDPAH